MNFHLDVTASPKISERFVFTAEQCAALFAAVLVHDEIDRAAELPDTVHLDYSQEQLAQCYWICLQLWKQGVQRDALRAMVEKIYRHRALDQKDQLSFKYARARFKHLRFAYATLDERHRYPRLFHWVTTRLGYLQDAFKNNQSAAVTRSVFLLRLFLNRFLYRIMAGKMEGFRPSTTESFRKYVDSEICFIRVHLAGEKITSKEFHEMRKVISRLVALYDNLKTLYPSAYHSQVSRYLSTINGMMGEVHDGLITGKFENPQDYYAAPFEIPKEIRLRLAALTEKYQAVSCSS